MTQTGQSRWIVPAAVIGPVVVGAALMPLRTQLDNANIALVLVVVVVGVAAAGRRSAAVIAALVAAGAFNFFHTKPYLSFRVDSSNDLETAALLLVVGLAVGEIAARGLSARSGVVRSRQDLVSLYGLGALVANGEDADYVLRAVESELTQLLGLVECRFEAFHDDAKILPVIARDGSVKWGPTAWETAKWGLPTDGATIPVWSRGVRLGRFLLMAPVAVPFTSQQLAQAVALVDQAGASLARRPANT